MNLHRSDKTPDWDKIPENEYNVWQKIAKKTNGILTPGNMVTLTGAALVISGASDLRNNKDGRGFTKLAIGRAADTLDGFLADKTSTKSPLGESLDAFVDSAETITFLPLMIKKDYLPLRTGIIYGIHKAINAGATAIAKRDGLELHTSWAGKRAEASRNFTVCFYGLSKLIENTKIDNKPLQKTLRFGAKSMEYTSIALGSLASAQYVLDVINQKNID